MKKHWKILIFIIICGCAFLIYRISRQEKTFQTAIVETGKIRQVITASGIIDPLSTVIVGTQVSGTIKEIYVDYNSEVKEGEMMALIDPDLFEATVAQRKAALDIAKAQVNVQENDITYYKKTLDRIQKLNTAKYSSEKELESAQRDYDNALAQLKLQEAQVEQAKAALNSAETELRYTKIKSPVDGIVISKSIEVGQTVAASFSTPELFTVAEDLTKMEIDASVVEADIAKIAVGQDVLFSVDSFPDVFFKGIVKQIRNQAVTTSNVVTYSVIISIDNADLKLKPGMTANVEIITAEKDDALLVPNQALRFYMDENSRYKEKGVWVMHNGTPQRINIKEGISDDNHTEIITDEITPGDEIIIARSNNKKEKKAALPRLIR